MLIIFKVETNMHLFHFFTIISRKYALVFIAYTHQKRDIPLFWINSFIHLSQQSQLGHLLALLVNLQGVTLH